MTLKPWPVLLAILLVTGNAAADGRTGEEPPPLPPFPSECGGIDPAADAQEAKVNGKAMLCLGPLAASCVLVRLDMLETELPLRDDYWRKVLAVRVQAAEDRFAIRERELIETETVLRDALEVAEETENLWKWLAVGAAIMGTAAGAAVTYALTR